MDNCGWVLEGKGGQGGQGGGGKGHCYSYTCSNRTTQEDCHNGGCSHGRLRLCVLPQL